MKCYAFIGIQGSGKGTQAVQLSNQLKYQHVNIGDLFRYNINNATPLGIQVKSIIQKGELVPDKLVFDLVNGAISPQADGIVFDGFPRTIAQAEYLIKHYDLLRVFYLDLEEGDAIARISSRRICHNCQENFNISTQPPKIQDICDNCGGNLIIRVDDQAEAIKKRFREFNEQTLPLKRFFEEKGLLVSIAAKGSIQEIFSNITSYLI
jgi:adenylate kinase